MNNAKEEGVDRRHPDTRAETLRRIKREFREMAGLSLTLAQANRLFDLRDGRGERLLRELVEEGFLQQTSDGSYSRPPD